MRTVLALTAAALLALAGCSSEPSGPSLDQQQQAWEEDMHDSACETIQLFSPGALELGWSTDAMAGGGGTADDIRMGVDALNREEPYNCGDATFDRFYEERMVEEFSDSPKGQAGETTSPSTP